MRVLPEEVDVVVIGGGITGASAAAALARLGRRVALLERSTIAAEQSSRAWGFIRQQGRHSAELPLAIEANRLWRELTEKYGSDATGFQTAGILVPAETAADEEIVQSGYQNARAQGLNTEILTPDGISALVPELRGGWRSALFTRHDGHADPLLSTQAMAAEARAAGALLIEHCRVDRLETSAGRISGVVTERGRIATPCAVLAGGIGSHILAADLNLSLPIQLSKSSVGRTQPAPAFTSIAMWGPRVAYRPCLDGRFVLGNGYRGVGMDYELTLDSFRALRHFLPAFRKNWRLMRLTLGPDFVHQLKAKTSSPVARRGLPEPVPNRPKVEHNLRAFRALFPHIGALELEAMWAGRLDLTPDAIPIIDQPANVPGLFLACGFSGHGFALGPSVGAQLSEWIVDGRPSLDLSAFRLARFAEGIVHQKQKAL